MSLTRDLAGSGAMLVRLLGIGARGGLSAETTLLHVLDGVPLPQAALVIPRLTPEAMDAIRKAGPGAIVPGPVHVADGATHPAATVSHGYGTDTSADEGDDPLCFEFPEANDPAQQDRLDTLNADAIERELGPDCWSGPSWTPAKGSKADQALDIWSTTQIDVDEIARRVGSTAGAVRSIVKKARKRGEPRAQRPTLALPAETHAAIEEARALPLKRDRAILLWERTALRPREIAEIAGSTPAAISLYMKVARREGHPSVLAGDAQRGITRSGPQSPAEAPMVVDGVGEDCATALPSKSDDIPPAGSNGESGRADPVPDVSPQEAPPCAEPVDEPSDRPADGAFPAPPPAQEPEDKGTVRQEQPTLDAPAASDTADRPAGPGLNSPPPVDQAIDAMVAGLAKKAGPDALLETLLDLYAGTTRLQKDIGTELGLSDWRVSTLIKAARAANDSRVVAGDAARAAMKAAAPPELAAVVSAKAAVAAKVPAPPSPPTPSRQHAAKPEPAPKPGDQPPGDLIELKHDQVLAVDRGWIVGPAGPVKGFPLIAGVLATLASGDLLPAKVVAQRSGARSGEAVLQMLQFWREDLGKIGVEIVRVGTADVRLRRKEA